jgi:FtsH-binding integral membrane protein
MRNDRDPRPQARAVAAEAVYSRETTIDRSSFLLRVYGHLLGAVAVFVLIETWLFQTGHAYALAAKMLGVNWMLVLGGFMVAGWMARGLASRAEGLGAQYAGLLLYVAAQAVIFVPLLVIAEYQAGGGVIGSAALLTLLGFTGLTLIVFQTRRDFSFLGGLLRWGGILALVAIAGGVFFGWNLGTWFSLAMIAFAGAAILYDTSKIIHYWPDDRYVGAALEIFASVALMFWYILRLLSSRR